MSSLLCRTADPGKNNDSFGTSDDMNCALDRNISSPDFSALLTEDWAKAEAQLGIDNQSGWN